jgi:hypothetical protein
MATFKVTIPDAKLEEFSNIVAIDEDFHGTHAELVAYLLANVLWGRGDTYDLEPIVEEV